ncbi:MAG: GGDEF domain-containing protein [Eubacteriales bacterium]
MNDENTRNIKGVRIRTVNIFMIAISCILYIFLIYNTAKMPQKYNKLISNTEEYIACEESASMVMRASDYLTEQVRLYVQNMDVKYMNAYFEEANITRRREKALDELKKYETSESTVNSLKAALQNSNDLMNREIYAMKLISLANGYGDDILPEEVRSCVITAADAALSPDKMIEKARELVFNEGYQDAKALIYSHLSHFTDGVIGAMEAKEEQSISELGDTIVTQRIFITLLFIMNAITFIAITLLIVKPLSIHIKRIKENETLEIVGSYEFKYLAFTYNDIYELNSVNEKMLEYKVEHDPLTGLLNRAAYDRLKMLLADITSPLALIVIDVDNFKQINDTYSHKVGDSVLRSTASILQGTFRSDDYVIRLGGDEFVIIMTNMTYENGVVIKRKFEKINNFLQTPEDGLPPITISAGVAFSERGFTDDLFSKADEALYVAKNNERKNCYFYKETDRNEVDTQKEDKTDDL